MAILTPGPTPAATLGANSAGMLSPRFQDTGAPPPPPSKPVAQTQPTITGSQPVGSTLTVNPANYTNSPTSRTYRFYRGGTLIAGAGGSSNQYVTTNADAGFQITGDEIASNAGGSSAPNTTSNSVTVVAKPNFTAQPQISASKPVVGTPVTVTPGTANGATSQSGQLYRDAVAIAGATGTTAPFSYTPVDADLGHTLTYVDSATNVAGTTNATSNAATLLDPTSVPGFVGWYDNSVTSTILSTGGLVSQVNDMVAGSSQPMTQATGTKQPSTGTMVNGKNALNYNVKVMGLPSAVQNLYNNATYTMIAVRRDEVANSGSGDFWIYGTGSTAGLVENASHFITALDRAGGQYAGSSLAFAANTNLHIMISTKSATSMQLVLDGAKGPLYNTRQQAVQAGAVVGGFSGGAGTGNQTMCEHIFYNLVLTDAQLNFIGNYCAGKWGSPWTNL